MVQISRSDIRAAGRDGEETALPDPRGVLARLAATEWPRARTQPQGCRRGREKLHSRGGALTLPREPPRFMERGYAESWQERFRQLEGRVPALFSRLRDPQVGQTAQLPPCDLGAWAGSDLRPPGYEPIGSRSFQRAARADAISVFRGPLRTGEMGKLSQKSQPQLPRRASSSSFHRCRRSTRTWLRREPRGYCHTASSASRGKQSSPRS